MQIALFKTQAICSLQYYMPSIRIEIDKLFKKK